MHSVKKNNGRVPVFNATFSNILHVFYRGDQFYLWRKPEHQEKTADLSQVTDKLYHIMLYHIQKVYFNSFVNTYS
jgi:hypothetical protein